MALTQKQMYEIAARDIACTNEDFMFLVTCEANPLVKEDLEALLAKRPHVYGRFAGYLRTLPTRAQVASPGFDLKAHWASARGA
jgi:hypothetical protein